VEAMDLLIELLFVAIAALLLHKTFGALTGSPTGAPAGTPRSDGSYTKKYATWADGLPGLALGAVSAAGNARRKAAAGREVALPPALIGRYRIHITRAESCSKLAQAGNDTTYGWTTRVASSAAAVPSSPERTCRTAPLDELPSSDAA